MRDKTPLFKKDGTLYKGDRHRMNPNSRWMTGRTHAKSSVYLYEFSEVMDIILKKNKKFTKQLDQFIMQ